MRRFVPLVVALVLCAVPAQAEFIGSDRVNLLDLMPPPPAEGSPQAAADLAEVLSVQAARTPEMEAQARADAEETVFRFAGPVLGDNFTKDNLPKTAAFFAKILADGNAVVDPAKDVWNRARPCQAHADQVKAVVPCSKSASHPSGHSTFAYEVAVLLSDMVPEKRAALFARADDYAHNRVVGGAHYPSDIEAGHVAGTVIAYALMQNPAFQAEFADVKAEIRDVLR